LGRVPLQRRLPDYICLTSIKFNAYEVYSI
jgi:hypothetical protein